jgi:esterase/lipase superfamily enzyme
MSTEREKAYKAVGRILNWSSRRGELEVAELESVHAALEAASRRMDVHELLQLWLKLVYHLAQDATTEHLAPSAADALARQLRTGTLKVTYVTQYEALTLLAEHLAIQGKSPVTIKTILAVLSSLDRKLSQEAADHRERELINQEIRGRLDATTALYQAMPQASSRGARHRANDVLPLRAVQAPDCLKIPTFFASFRARGDARTHPYHRYGASWSEAPNYGVALVSVPEFRKAYTIPRKHDHEQSAKMTAKIDRGLYFVVERIDDFSDEDHCFEQLKRAVHGRTLMVFIHGFRQSHASALVHAAQLFKDLRIDGAPLLLSWPSGFLFGDQSYFAAIRDARVHDLAKHFAQIINRAVESVGAASVLLIGHSLGCRVLAQALASVDLASRSIAHIVMASPDIPLSEFDAGLKPALQAQKRLLVYASARDKALKAAEIVDDDRAGRLPRLLTLSHGEIVDTEQCYADSFDFSRHSDFSYGAAPDLREAIARVHPEERGLYKHFGAQRQVYWSFA